MIRLAFAVLAVSLSFAATAGSNFKKPNKPCTGKKGGISHCEGRQFICRDGTKSQSKKDCQAFLSPSAVTQLSAPDNIHSK